MIRHIVFWELADEAEGRKKSENARIIKEGLESLVGVVPGLLEAEVGINENSGEYDAALVSLFENLEALEGYQTHPAHQKVRSFVSKVRLARTAVDYEI